MSRLRLRSENQLIGRIGWLRAAVLGASDSRIQHLLRQWISQEVSPLKKVTKCGQ